MNYLEKRKNIDRILLKLYSCKTSDEFYQLSTRLYYYVNDVVYGLHSRRFDRIEDEKMICKNCKNCINNKDLKLIIKTMIGKEMTYDNLLQAIHDFGYLTIKESNLEVLFRLW